MSNSLTPVVSSGAPSLTALQQQVLALLSAGSTLSAAAQAAGIHRNTIVYWRRTSTLFRDTLADALAQKAQFWQDQAEELAASAIDAIRTILSDPKAPAGVRLKAALSILDKVSSMPPETSRVAPPAVVQPPQETEIVHKNAQTTSSQTNPSPVQAAPAPPEPSPARAKIGRNETCPCGSGVKFKRCCLNKAATA